MQGLRDVFRPLWRHVFEGKSALKSLKGNLTVLTLYFRLKKDYIYYIKDLGSTGAGLDPADVTPGSEVDNLVGESFSSLSFNWFH